MARDLIIATNNNLLKAYRNQGTSRKNTFAVKLIGLKNNPQAIGARVIMTRQDGPQQVREVTAGSGYLSQSTASLYFGLGTEQGPKQIDVLWPNGTKTVIKDSLQKRNFIIKQGDGELSSTN